MTTKSINTIRIFLASSTELKSDRDQFADFITRLNMHYEPRGYRFILYIWEFLDPAYNNQRKQNEYNNEIRKCDFFVALFHTKVGKYTIEELEAAQEECKKRELPMFIYFRDLDYWQTLQQKDKNLEEVKKHIGNDMNHFWGSYNNIEKLHLDFVLWLDNKLEQNSTIKVEGDEVRIGDLHVAQFSQLPFASNNSEYQRLDEQLADLKQDIELLRQDTKEHPDNEKLSARLYQKIITHDKLQQEIQRQQEALLGAAKRISEMRNQQISDKFAMAAEAFEKGQLTMANTYLNELQQEGDLLFKKITIKHEQKLEQVHKLIDALILQAQVIMSDTSIPIEKRIARVADIYAKANDWATRSAYDKKEYAKLLLDYARFHYKYGHYKEAEQIYLRQINLSEEVNEKESVDTATSYNEIGTVYRRQSDYVKALEYHFKALAIKEKVSGKDHPSTASSYNDIGLVYDDLGDYDKALEYHFKALPIREKVLGTDHPDTAQSYNNIGVVYKEQGDYDKALEYYFKALAIDKKALGDEHPDTATDYCNIGTVYDDLGEYDKALEYHFKALAIDEKVLGAEHPDTATDYNNIGVVYKEQGDYDKALEYYLKALVIDEKAFGTDHPNTAFDYTNIGEVYNKKGEINKAQEFYSKSIPIIEKELGVERSLDISDQNKDNDPIEKELLQQSKPLDQNTFRIIDDIIKCTAALNDVYIDFQKELQVLADDLRQTFSSEYCAIGIVDGNLAEDCIVSLEPHEEKSLQKLQSELLESVRFVEITNKKILLCQALDLKSQKIVYFDKEVISKSETFGKFQEIMKSGTVFSNIVIPLRDKSKRNIGYLQFLNSKDEFEFDRISPLLMAFLGLTKTILQKNIKQRKENREKDFDFYDKIQKAKSANQLLDEIMEYLATEFKAAIVSFRIPIANAPQKRLSHFYLRSCYVNERLKNHYSIKKHYQKERTLIPRAQMGGYEDSHTLHKEQIIYHVVKDTSIINRFNLDLYNKYIVLPVFRDDTTTKSLIKQLYGTFQLRLFNPTISTDKKTELISRIRFERELADAKKRLTFLSEQISLLFNSRVHRFENESLQIFQSELRNSSFVKIRDFDERCVNIIKNSVRASVCSIYRFDKATDQLTLSATTAQTIHFNETNENLDANSNKDKCSIPVASNKNLLVSAFTTKKTTYIFDIRDSKVHQSPFIENLDKKTGEGFISAMIIPILKKNGECPGVVLLLGRDESNRFISTAYWEHDISHIEFIVNTLTRISESDNERMTFLSQLSHELLSPVAEMVYDNDYIITLADANPNSATKQKLIAQLQDNLDTCMLLKYLISDTEFRYASRGQSMEYNIVQQDKPQEILMDAIHLLNKEAIDKEITFDKNFSNMPPMYFDRERMMQVFLNLLKNAIRYSYNSTEINISYQLRNNQHEIIFANYGIGVLEEEREAIFNLFYRGQETKGKFVRGTGIGLYIVRDIMRNHGGDCFVRNLKEPTEVVITLPNKIIK